MFRNLFNGLIIKSYPESHMYATYTEIHHLNLDISPKSRTSRRVGFPLNGLRIPFLANIENGMRRSQKRETFLGKVKRDNDYSLRKI